ncbi:hypothetical protein FCL47_00205 [Desulfopila sp. IMCC35006]|uniref:hypothetical protein n=1 Tax=Desulfopila sp. IMCC35006 TaxID=2569542 RepID=UPI0010ACFCCE|nr:hypothetical protein [Desulfopila sp. IMCC35006]TKB27954.1 hypothetical protein FCL47_00205 [Desulfopila sp. IMCC35006]
MEKDQKVRIGGIKFSEELIQVTVAKKSPDDLSICRLLHLIAEKNINISFLCHSVFTRTPETIFCVESSELDAIRNILKAAAFPDEHFDIIRSVGTLTLFPHRNELKLLGLIIDLFGACNFPVYSFSTSISAIALNTDFLSLDNIAKKLQTVLLLPDNHAPFRQGFRVTQIQM